MNLASVINILADGQFHSGESLGSALGITRAAVWKRLQALSALGLNVESVKGRGYRLRGGLCLLSAPLIQKELTAEGGALLGMLSCFDEVDSTNQFLLSGDAGRGDVCLAERQTAGRGRRGRDWVSPYGQNIYLSLRWQYEQGVTALEGLSLAVGAVVADLLEHEFHLQGLSLKWPNDLMLDERKLGGVLIEVGGDLTGDCAVVVGLGLNVSMSVSSTPEPIGQPWADLLQAGIVVDRNRLAALLISRLLPLLASYPLQGFQRYRSLWLAYAAYLDAPVTVHSQSRSLAGILRGVDGGGSLVVEVDGKQQVFSGGEVSLRSS